MQNVQYRYTKHHDEKRLRLKRSNTDIVMSHNGWLYKIIE